MDIHLWMVRNAKGHEIQEIQSSLCSVNTAFSVLRTLIPTEPADRKLSKIETLRLASSYISHLGAVLVAGPIDQPCLRIDDSGGVYGTSHWADSRTRPQVCTFCLAMHKKHVSVVVIESEMNFMFALVVTIQIVIKGGGGGGGGVLEVLHSILNQFLGNSL